MSNPGRTPRLFSVFSVIGAIVIVGSWLLSARQNPVAVAVHRPLVVAAAGKVPTTTMSPSTTIPDIEALIPLSTEAMTGIVARSVGFVLSEHGTGSGVVIGDDLLVTNAHVVWPDSIVTVVFQNGAIVHARVLALDPFVDLAVVDLSGLSRKPAPIAIGSVTDLSVGDALYVLGYPAPDEFTPEPSLDRGEVRDISDWEFTGVRWVTIEAPAIGGQSGGAVVDQYGRLVGVSTFGSIASLTSIAIDDVLTAVDRLLASPVVRGLEPRTLPHNGAKHSNDVSLAGPWDQQLLLGWFVPSADVAVDWAPGSGELRATTLSGDEITAGEGSIDFVPEYAFPVVVDAEADTTVSGSVSSSLPLIAYPDPDHGKFLPRRGATPGIYDVGGDRDFFYLTLEEGEDVSITIESAARTLLTVYGPDGEVVAADNDFAGFIESNASTQFTARTSGRHIVAIESSHATVSGYMVVTQ